MGIVGAIITILGGLLAASTFIIARRPDAKATLDKLERRIPPAQREGVEFVYASTVARR